MQMIKPVFSQHHLLHGSYIDILYIYIYILEYYIYII